MTLRMVFWGAVLAVVSVLAFLWLDPILAAFVAILLVTAAGIGYVARDWDQHSTYEEREAVRAQKRAAKWDRNKAARDRDRVRWEAHQARRPGHRGAPAGRPVIGSTRRGPRPYGSAMPTAEPTGRRRGARPRPEPRHEPASGEGDGVLYGPAADARATLDEHDHAAFDRLAAAVLASPSAPLGPLLRAQLPGTAGVRWLRQEQLSPTTRPGELTSAHWLSLFAAWSSAHQAPTAGGPGGRRSGGRPSTHGHASGAGGRPRWGQ